MPGGEAPTRHPPAGEAPLVPVGVVDRATPGRPWWSYQRNGAPTVAGTTNGHDAGGRPPPPPGRPEPDDPAPSGPRRLQGMGVAALPPQVTTAAVSAAGLLVLALLLGRVGPPRATVVVLLAFSLVLSVGVVGRLAARAHPDEQWVGRWLAWGVVAKVVACYFRWYTLEVGYGGIGDATGYHNYGRRFAAAWNAGEAAPFLEDLRKTNFIRWFTGVVYYVFGSDMLVGFVVYGLIAVAGSYLWFRATADAVPFLNKRMYLALVLFVPSIAFWPSSIGKEALMQLGIGVMALATARVMGSHLLRGLLMGVAGGWLLWVVRPHLLALVTVAGGVAYLAGRTQGRRGGRTLLTRPAGLVVIGFLVIFAVSEGAKFLGIDQLSIASIEAELDEQTERTSSGGSEFDPGENSLNPIYLPEGMATVLLRPFPWETETNLQLLASAESVFVAGLIVLRISSVRRSLRESRRYGFLLYAWVLTIAYAATFSSFANFGLLVRQRSLVLPALFVLLAVRPGRTPAPAPETATSPQGGMGVVG